jgi:hypothetical protein
MRTSLFDVYVGEQTSAIQLILFLTWTDLGMVRKKKPAGLYLYRMHPYAGKLTTNGAMTLTRVQVSVSMYVV